MTDMKKMLAGAMLALSLAAPLSAQAEEAPADSQPAATQRVGMANPYIQYRTVPELELAIGFPVFYLPSNIDTIYHPAVSIYGIHGLVADLRFQSNRDTSTLMVRSALYERVQTTDISGHHSVVWEEIDAGDMKHTKVQFATLGPDSYTAHWRCDRFVYSIDFADVDKETFLRFLKAFVATGDRFAYKFRNFQLNTQNVDKILREAEAVTNPETAAQLEAEQKAAQEATEKQKNQPEEKKEWFY